MSLPWVRRTYGVPAIRGGIVRFDGQPGRILSATHHLHIRLDDGKSVWIHPAWRVEYQECHEAVWDRAGEMQPCDRPAVGWRYDVESGDMYPVCRRHHRPPFDPEPVECEHCCGSGNTKVHVKGATVDAPCTPCAGQGVVEP